jgi:uncharacterized protein (TIGR02391 family)
MRKVYMRNIFSDLPNPENMLRLDVHELAGYLLTYLKSFSDRERAQLRRESVVSRPYHSFDTPPAYQGLTDAAWQDVSQALMEAWAFLEQNGFIVQEPGGKFFITRRGEEQKITLVEDVRDMYGLHPSIHEKCYDLYKNRTYAEAVEKSFKVVKDRLRNLTTFESGSDAFGKGKLYIRGAAAPNVDNDFNQAVKFLTMAIDQFRNEKSHTSDAKIEDPVRAYQYLMLSSLAMSLLEDTEIRQ